MINAVYNTLMKKKNRVKKAEEFQYMIHHSKKQVNQSFVVYSSPKKEAEARIGISLSKKIGNAVHRNKIKRQVRMMFHDTIDFKVYPSDAVIIIRFNYNGLDFDTNKKNLEKIMVKATIE